MTNLFESLVNDPLNTILALVLFGVIVLFLKYAVPFLRRQLATFLGEQNLDALYALVIRAVQAAEQAQRKGELDALLDSFGLNLPVDLADEDRCREYAIAAVQAQLNKFPWGRLVDVATIYELVLSALNQDLHESTTIQVSETPIILPE